MPIHDSETFIGTTCAIIGTRTEMQDIDHVGLLATATPLTLQRKQLAKVYDMGTKAPAETELRVDLMGCLGHLDSDTQKEMRLWARALIHRGAEIKYHVLPASIKEASDMPGGPPTYLKFSCVGFVARCYRDAGGIQLVVDEAYLPPVDLDTLKKIWPAVCNSNPLVATRIRRRYGLDDDPPWTILMPAYLFHAIRHFDNNGPNAGPYQPVAGDWQFPRATSAA